MSGLPRPPMLRRRADGPELVPDPHAPAVTEPEALAEPAPFLEPLGDFGHEPMSLPELVANLRDRAEQAKRLDDVPVGKAELGRLLAVVDEHLQASDV